ncbi:unnamed protein product [Jaminaea pallidilutea]
MVLISRRDLISAYLLAASLVASTPVTPTAGKSDGQSRSFAVSKRSGGPSSRTGDDLVNWAKHHRGHLRNKYGLATDDEKAAAISRRDVGSASLVNYQYDSTWFAQFQIGTPAKGYNLVLDTGSSDIWLSGTNYTPSASSTFTNKSSSFNIEYGSGQVSGYMATDKFTFADHTVANQPFAVGTTVSSNLQDQTTAGIAGLGFQSLSVSGSGPFWQLAGETEFSFYLQRATQTSSSSSSGGGGGGEGGGGGGTGGPGSLPGKKRALTVSSTSPGGVFTLGGRNSSLFQGDINWSDVISKTYWLITLGGIGVSNSDIDIGTLNKAAIDTGTTLIGGPTSTVEAFYAKIQGASALTSADGYYSYPCSTNVSATMTFGNQKYTIDSDSFRVATLDASGNYCMGALFSVGSTSSNTLQWIVGDVVLTGLYSIFDNSGSTARVGFASLADGLNDGGSSSTTVARTQPVSSGFRASPLTAALLSTVLASAVACLIHNL